MQPCPLLQASDKFSIDPVCLKESVVSCFGRVDDARVLLGDLHGQLMMLFVEQEERMEEDRAVVTALRLETLGEVCASTHVLLVCSCVSIII